MTRKVSCVIPAFNEAPRIGQVLASVIGHPLIAEVIVVDDGSSDGTSEIVSRTAGARLVEMPENGGKSRAVAAGIEAAGEELLLLVDSDLVGLRPADLTRLIAPVGTGRADVSISLRGNAPRTWRAIGLDYISGERVVSRGMLGPVEAMRRLPRFGLEVAMNDRLIAERARIAVVRWPEVASPWKGSKRGAWQGMKDDAKMLADMFRTVPLPRAAAQIRAMRRLRVPASAE